MNMPYAADLGIAGDIAIAITFDYQPAESRTHWEPGCPASAEVTGVTMADGSAIPPEIAAGLMDSLRGDADIEALCVEHAIKTARDEADNAAIDRAEYEQSRIDDLEK